MDIFLAKQCNFQGESGYMVRQIHKGKVFCEQFVSDTSYEDFCKWINTEPAVDDRIKFLF
jgi:hypothetical protein